MSSPGGPGSEAEAHADQAGAGTETPSAAGALAGAEAGAPAPLDGTTPEQDHERLLLARVEAARRRSDASRDAAHRGPPARPPAPRRRDARQTQQDAALLREALGPLYDAVVREFLTGRGGATHPPRRSQLSRTSEPHLAARAGAEAPVARVDTPRPARSPSRSSDASYLSLPLAGREPGALSPRSPRTPSEAGSAGSEYTSAASSLPSPSTNASTRLHILPVVPRQQPLLLARGRPLGRTAATALPRHVPVNAPARRPRSPRVATVRAGSSGAGATAATRAGSRAVRVAPGAGAACPSSRSLPGKLGGGRVAQQASSGGPAAAPGGRHPGRPVRSQGALASLQRGSRQP